MRLEHRIRALPQVTPERRLPLARTGTNRYRRGSRHLRISRKKPAIASRPWNSIVTGGMVNHASSVSNATTASMSSSANAVANRPATSRSRAERGSGARSRPGPGSRCAIVARARCSALFTEASLLSQHVRHLGGPEAQHVPEHERGPLPRRQVLDGGHEGERDRLFGLVLRFGPRLRIGESLEQVVRVGLQPHRLTPPGRLDGEEIRPGGHGSGRRSLARSAFRHRFVAIRYSQVRSEARCSYWPSPRQAASKVSCKMSSASCTEPRIR